MSLIPDLSEIPDLSPILPTSSDTKSCGEHDIRVIKAQGTSSKKNGRNGILLVCDIIGEDEASNLMHTLWFGNFGDYNKDDEDKSNLMWRMVKDFLRAVGLSEDGNLEAEDFEGLEFSAELEYDDGKDEDGNEEYPPKNVIKRIT